MRERSTYRRGTTWMRSATVRTPAVTRASPLFPERPETRSTGMVLRWVRVTMSSGSASIRAPSRRIGSGHSASASLRRRSQEFFSSCPIAVKSVGRSPSFGKSVTFSHKRNNRRWLPNIQRVRVKHGSNTRRARVCTSCIRAGKVEKA